MSYRIAVIGATGQVGREVLSLLVERKFPFSKVTAAASEASLGQEVSFGEDHVLAIEPLDTLDPNLYDVAFFCVDERVSKKWIPKFRDAGVTVIDKSSYYRLHPTVPLVVPEVNGDDLDPKHFQRFKEDEHPLDDKENPSKQGLLIANPNCVAGPLALVLHVLRQHQTFQNVICSTYQSVSGVGKKGMEELFQQTKGIFVNDDPEPQCFDKQIAFNVIPFIGDPAQKGQTSEEEKIRHEVRKILSMPLTLSVTSVRVPVFIGHAASVHVVFDGAIDMGKIKTLFEEAESVMIIDRPDESVFATPIDIVGEDMVCLSRVRQESPQSLTFWATWDNLRKGAALNAVQIAEALHAKKLMSP